MIQGLDELLEDIEQAKRIVLLETMIKMATRFEVAQDLHIERRGEGRSI